MIVIEGPDMAGKSSLAQRLFEILPTAPHAGLLRRSPAPMVRHFTKPPPSFDKYWGYRECVQRNVILDRFHMSHPVYRHIAGEEHDLTPFKYQLVDSDIAKVGGIIVLLVPSERELKKRWDQHAGRGEMYDLDFVLRVRRVFSEIGCKRLLMTKNGEYLPRVDLFVENDSWTTERIAEVVADLWVARQAELEAVNAWRPASLD